MDIVPIMRLIKTPCDMNTKMRHRLYSPTNEEDETRTTTFSYSHALYSHTHVSYMALIYLFQQSGQILNHGLHKH